MLGDGGDEWGAGGHVDRWRRSALQEKWDNGNYARGSALPARYREGRTRTGWAGVAWPTRRADRARKPATNARPRDYYRKAVAAEPGGDAHTGVNIASLRSCGALGRRRPARAEKGLYRRGRARICGKRCMRVAATTAHIELRQGEAALKSAQAVDGREPDGAVRAHYVRPGRWFCSTARRGDPRAPQALALEAGKTPTWRGCAVWSRRRPSTGGRPCGMIRGWLKVRTRGEPPHFARPRLAPSARPPLSPAARRIGSLAGLGPRLGRLR